MEDNVLYHGSTEPVSAPLVHLGRSDLDFGPGFYLTADRSQAERWAHTKASRLNGGRAYLNVFHFNIEEFRKVNCSKLVFDAYDKQWLDFIAASRKGGQPWKGLDWIEGGIANDRVITTVDLYVDGIFTIEQALDRLVSESLRHQVCIANQDIVDIYLNFVESIEL